MSSIGLSDVGLDGRLTQPRDAVLLFEGGPRPTDFRQTASVESVVPPPIPAVAEWLDNAPVGQRDCLDQLRMLIFEVARDVDAWPLVEEMKWGQPSYRSPHGNESTPVRLGWTDAGDAAILAHCQTRVIPEFRDAFSDRFRFDGDRAVLFGSTEELFEAELAELVRHALTYRR